MNSFRLNFVEETASRVWTAASAKIELKLASGSQGIQAFSLRDGNKFKAIAASNKYFLTISNENFGPNDCCEPRG